MHFLIGRVLTIIKHANQIINKLLILQNILIFTQSMKNTELWLFYLAKSDKTEVKCFKNSYFLSLKI